MYGEPCCVLVRGTNRNPQSVLHCRSSAAVPLHTAGAFVACWAVALVPLTMLAGLSGRRSAAQRDRPRVHENPRAIPNILWKGMLQRSSWERFLPHADAPIRHTGVRSRVRRDILRTLQCLGPQRHREAVLGELEPCGGFGRRRGGYSSYFNHVGGAGAAGRGGS